jgi:NADH:ubiquinone oxidoreductase subunit F (NADH-binding)
MLVKEAEKLRNGEPDKKALLNQMVRESELMAATSLCPLGQSPILPLKSAAKYFADELTK